jgi:hypothetical protein
MPERTNTESTMDDDGEGQADESSLIKSLRQKLRDSEAKAKAAAEAVSTAREQVKREMEIGSLVNQAGYPGLSEIAVEKVKEPTPEAVAEFLKGLGLEPKVKAEESSQPEGKTDLASEVAGVANLGQQVAAAASGKATGDLASRVAKAKTQEELIEIAREGGFLQQ